LALDVTLPDATERLDAVLAGNGLYLDVLINNAGFGFAGRFHEQDAGEIGRLIALNIEAVTRLMHHALPPMIARGRGGILNVASLGGFVPGPQQAAYYASKAYVLSLTEAVAHEARGLGVRISAVAPGPVETAFHRNMGAEPALYRSVLPSLSAERAANSAYAGFMLGRRVIVPGILAPLAAAALRLLPHTLSVPIVGQLLAVHAPGARTVAGPPDAAPPD
jgi:short-subunit dehydrogenase